MDCATRSIRVSGADRKSIASKKVKQIGNIRHFKTGTESFWHR
ncbi:MAG: hypothetical protein JWL59_4667 [Chthoniobacteraceae bacterium]|nr:hypothetical protein [Chthoniobacteraceae bacterium]